MQLERLWLTEFDFVSSAVNSKSWRHTDREVTRPCHLEPVRHTKTVKIPRVKVTRIRMKLLLGDEIVLEQQLTVVVGGFARD